MRSLPLTLRLWPRQIIFRLLVHAKLKLDPHAVECVLLHHRTRLPLMYAHDYCDSSCLISRWSRPRESNMAATQVPHTHKKAIYRTNPSDIGRLGPRRTSARHSSPHAAAQLRLLFRNLNISRTDQCFFHPCCHAPGSDYRSRINRSWLSTQGRVATLGPTCATTRLMSFTACRASVVSGTKKHIWGMNLVSLSVSIRGSRRRRICATIRFTSCQRNSVTTSIELETRNAYLWP